MGEFNALEKKGQQMTFDFNGNMIMVKKPKVKTKQTVLTGYQLSHEASVIEHKDLARRTQRDLQSNDDSLDDKNSNGTAFSIKAYYGNVI